MRKFRPVLNGKTKRITLREFEGFYTLNKMSLLGIDYGRVNLGLAVAQEFLPTPLKVIRSKSDSHKIEEIVNICKKENIKKIIIGKGSADLEKHIQKFSKVLRKKTTCEVVIVDETLTSDKAYKEMVFLSVPRKRRKEKEHSFAAAFLLSAYLIQKNKNG